MSDLENYLKSVKKLTRMLWGILFGILGLIVLIFMDFNGALEPYKVRIQNKVNATGVSNDIQKVKIWQAPDTALIPVSKEGELIRYGKKLIEHTALYFGPKGKVKAISNGMNCQNCHLNAGTLPYGNNYAAVASKYPTFRGRSGTIETYEKRVNDCIERSLNGEKIDENSREMKAIVAYLKWVGQDIKKGQAPKGIGLPPLPLLNRPADPKRGALVYENFCLRCHGKNGEGTLSESGIEWVYPPLFGEKSYSIGAGMFRISTFAAFVKANMPYGITFENPFLTNEEAWDVAAYINSMPRPDKDISGDWPDISLKPFDHPFGPYSDGFSENQHKFGPFAPIKDYYDNKGH